MKKINKSRLWWAMITLILFIIISYLGTFDLYIKAAEPSSDLVSDANTILIIGSSYAAIVIIVIALSKWRVLYQALVAAISLIIYFYVLPTYVIDIRTPELAVLGFYSFLSSALITLSIMGVFEAMKPREMKGTLREWRLWISNEHN